MKNYKVKIVETLTYYIDIEADSPELAEELAYNSNEFCQNNHQDNDAVTESIEEVPN